jgi:cobalt-zinc-cadmium efflux system membrane fusion protein
MKFQILLLGLLILGQVVAREKVLRLDAEQISHLDVRTALPESVATIPLAQAPGRVVLPPAREFSVSAFQPGVITRVNVAQGVKVDKNDVLAEINSVTLLDAERALVDANAAYHLAEARMQRDETLLREGVISKLRTQETRGEFERARAALRAAEQTLLASGVSAGEIGKLKISQLINGIYQVLAPIDGVVLDRMAIVGQRVDALSPLFRIGKLGELWLEVDMPQERYKEAGIGDVVTVDSPRARARIIEIGQNVNLQSQSVMVRARVEQGAEWLRPGMQVNVQLMHRSTDRGFRVPPEAVFSHEGRHYVFVRQALGFEAREVAVAGQEAYGIVLHEGLQDGEEVVVQGVAPLKSAWLGDAGGSSHGHAE